MGKIARVYFAVSTVFPVWKPGSVCKKRDFVVIFLQQGYRFFILSDGTKSIRRVILC